MFKQIKQEVLKANLLLPRYNLVTFTWGNVSAVSEFEGERYVVIKPSGVEYDSMTIDDMVVVTLDGKVVEGKLNPSSDTATHLELYKSFPNIKGIVHTHSRWATIFSQAGMAIKPYGTTHADYFADEIPCTRDMTKQEIDSDYERNTGRVIAEAFNSKDPDKIPAVLVKNHGPFTWGATPLKAVENAVVLEEVAMMALYTRQLAGDNLEPMLEILLNKHFNRKHGDTAYYGQR